MAENEPHHYDVLQNEKYGRYLVANKDLLNGELIFTDKPFAFGPKPDSCPLCLGCYGPVEGRLCSKCGWPVCSEECETAAAHQGECGVFSAANVRFQPVDDWTAAAPQLDCITPLRLLLAKEQDPERWQLKLSAMEAHTAARQQRPTWAADQVNVADFLVDHCKLGTRFDKDLVQRVCGILERPTWAADQVNVADFLVDHCKLGTHFDKDLVQRVCGILEVNAVEVPSRGGFSIRAIYPRLAIAAHSCVPNIVHSIFQNNYEVHVRAAVPIKSGDMLHLCYTYALSPTLVRQDYLLESKFFKCECARCTDPTELGTHLSTLKCQKCDNGVIMSTNPLDGEAPWKCTEKSCEFKTSTAAMRKMLAVVQAEIDQLDALEPGPQLIEQREATLNKYKSVFHPRHSLLLSVKHSLAQLYGRVEGYTLDELPDIVLERKQPDTLCSAALSVKHSLAQLYGRVEGYTLDELPDIVLERKAEFCRLVLNTLDVVMPGESRMRGMMIYELHAPLMFLARSEFGAGLITQEKLKERLQEPINCLAEAARILSREDPQSPEGITGQIAYQSMEQLKASLESL